MTRREEVRAAILDLLPAMIIFACYAVAVVRASVNEESMNIFLGIKLGGGFALCCLTPLSARSQRPRVGRTLVWNKLLFSRIVYIVAWTHIVYVTT